MIKRYSTSGTLIKAVQFDGNNVNESMRLIAELTGVAVCRLNPDPELLEISFWGREDNLIARNSDWVVEVPSGFIVIKDIDFKELFVEDLE